MKKMDPLERQVKLNEAMQEVLKAKLSAMEAVKNCDNALGRLEDLFD